MAGTTHLELRFLGPLAVLRGGERQDLPPSKKTLALLAYLALTGRPHRRDSLCDLLWDIPDDPRAALRWSLSKLRPLVDDTDRPRIVADRTNVAFEPADAAIDVLGVRQALTNGLAEISTAELTALVDGFGGEFLEGLDLPNCPNFQAWCVAAREDLRTQRGDLLAELVRRLADTPMDALPYARQWVELDPFDEASRARLVALLIAADRRAEAEQQYRAGRQALDELGAPLTGELEAAWRSSRAEPATSALPVAVREPSAAGPGRPTVAVRPFECQDGDGDAQKLVAGLTDELIAALASWRTFPVVGHETMSTRDHGTIEPREFARQLGARYVVSGGVRRVDSLLRFNVKLIDAISGYQVWTARFDRLAEGNVEIADEIASRIVSSVAPAVEQAEFRRSVARASADLTAWDCYVRGVANLNEANAAGTDRARAMFVQAIGQEPDFSEAHAGLAMAYLRDLMFGRSEERARSLADAFSSAHRAVALDHESSYAHVALGSCHVWAGQHEMAIAEMRKALALCPCNTHARFSLGNQLDIAGQHDEGIALLEDAVQSNPRNPRGQMYLCSLARAYLNARQYEEAHDLLLDVIGRTPGDPYAHFLLAICHGLLGEPDAARVAADACRRIQPDFIERRADWRIYRDDAANQRLLDGLRGTGLLDPAARPEPNAEASAARPASPPPSLRPAPLDGERKHVTVMFADIKGSGALIDGLDPEAAMERLAPALGVMTRAVNRFEGTVCDMHGDGIMALFGAPLAHEDHAVRACHAALAMQEAMQELSDAELAIRVGLHSGEVVAGYVGETLSRRYDASGPTVHRAYRVEQQVEPGRIGLTAETRRQAEGFITVQPLTLDDGLFELTGSTAARTRWEAQTTRGLTRFIGREADLAKMERALERAAAGQGEVVAIVGGPGMGKSRLVHEFLKSPRTQEWTVLASAMAAHEQNTPTCLLCDLIGGWIGVGKRIAAPEIAERLKRKIDALDPALNAIMPALQALLDLPLDDDSGDWQRLSAEERRQRTRDAISQLFIRMSQARPLILIVEDLHWLNDETQALLDGLVDALTGVRLFLLVTYRPEYRHDWAGKSYFRLIRADPLHAETADRMLCELLGDDPALDALRRMIIERTDGTPLFLEETVRNLQESGVLARDRGRFRLRKPIDELEMPSSVQAVLAARMDRLPPTSKRLLQTASVIGKDVPVAFLRPIAGLDAPTFDATLADLQSAEILYQTRLPPDAEFTFKHALVHDVAYDSLLLGRRRALHVDLFRAIEAQHPEALDDWAESLARHAFAGALWSEAVAYLRRAAARAIERSAHLEAVDYFEKALAALPHLPESADRDRLELDILLTYGPILAMTGGWGVASAEQAYQRARELAQALDSPTDRFAAAWGAWLNEQFRPKPAAARDLAADVLAIAETRSETEFPLQAHHAAWTTAIYAGEIDAALDHARQGIAIYDPDRDHAQTFTYGGHDPGVCGHVTVALCQWLLGRPDQALDMARKTVGLANRLGHQPSLALAHWHLARLHQCRREAPLALEHLRRTLDLCADSGLHRLAARCIIAEGWNRVASGEIEAGLARMKNGMTAWQAAGLHRDRPRDNALLAMAYVAAGELETARETVEHAVGMVEKSGERTWEADVLRMHGEVGLAHDAGQSQAAEAMFQAALDVARAQQAKSLELRAATSLARHWHRTGAHRKARDLLAPLHDWFTEGFDTADLTDAKALLDDLH